MAAAGNHSTTFYTTHTAHCTLPEHRIPCSTSQCLWSESGPEQVNRKKQPLHREIQSITRYEYPWKKCFPRRSNSAGTVVGLEKATTIALDVGALACSKKSECKRQFWQESGACNSQYYMESESHCSSWAAFGVHRLLFSVKKGETNTNEEASDKANIECLPTYSVHQWQFATTEKKG